MPLTPRDRARSIAAGRGARHTLAVPLAPRLAARIAERPWEAFTTDPTQLANGLGDLIDAVAPDGVAVTLPSMQAGDAGAAHRAAALEATGRLRTSHGEVAVLLAVLDGGHPDVLDLATAFVEAGVDGVVLEAGPGGVGEDASRTIGNVARFHRAMAHVVGAGAGLPAAQVVPLHAPRAATGLVLTDGEVPADTPVPDVTGWIAAVRG